MKPQIELYGFVECKQSFRMYLLLSILCAYIRKIRLFSLFQSMSPPLRPLSPSLPPHRIRFYFVFQWASILSPPSSLPHTFWFHKKSTLIPIWPFSYWDLRKRKWYILHLAEYVYMFALKMRKYSRNKKNPPWNDIIV